MHGPAALLAIATGALWLAGCGPMDHGAGAADTIPTPAAAPKKTRLLFGGDVMLARYVGRLSRQRNDAAFPFRELAPVLAAADIAFVNLESPFAETPPYFGEGMIFRARPEMIQGLTLAGVDVVSTANNHARDAGSAGVAFTLRWLAGNGILAAGTGPDEASAHEGVVLERNGLKFGFLAYTYDQANGNYPQGDRDARIAGMDLAHMRKDVCELRSWADVVIVSMHAGIEYQSTPTAFQQRFARAAIDAGAAVVVGHHPHVVQPAERYGPGVIFYSLGNLVFDQFQRTDTQHGLLAEVVFLGANLEQYKTLPVALPQTAPRLQ